ncbi:Hypothetical Protein FCC1311_115142, partial [Hondaea fermentalgiana]
MPRGKEDRSVAPTTSVDENHVAITIDKTDDENTFKTCFGCLRPKKSKKITMRELRQDGDRVKQSLVLVEDECKRQAEDLVQRQGAFPLGKTRLVKHKNSAAELAAEDRAKPFFTHDHVRAIEDGDFLYDPVLVQAVVDVGQRLANLDHYVSDSSDHKCLESYNSQDDHPQQDRVRFIDSRMTEVLLSDVEDFLHIISKMINKMEFLRECYRSKHVSILEDAR